MNRMILHDNLSMLPLIEPKDKILVEEKDYLKVDDIAIFKFRDNLIAHRIIYIYPEGNKLVTKGDNNKESDGVIHKTMILGSVNEIIRNKEKINLNHFYLTQSAIYIKTLKSFLSKLNRENIDHINLKGLPLHLFYSSKKPNRVYYDVDLLIRKKDFIKTKKILKEFKFISQSPKLLNEKVKSTQYSFVNDAKPFPVIIDLHLEPAIGLTKIATTNKLVPNLDRYTKHLFKSINKVKVNGVQVNILKKDAFILYLLLHLYHHNFKGAHRINFINNVIGENILNWKNIANIIKELEYENFVYPAALVVNKLYKNTFPKKFLANLTPNSFYKNSAKIIAETVNVFDEDQRNVAGIKRFIMLILLSPVNLSRKLKLILSSEVLAYYLTTIKSLFFKFSKNSPKSFLA